MDHYNVDAIVIGAGTAGLACGRALARTGRDVMVLEAANETTVSKMAIFGALKLYLDFINLFLFLLRFLGDRR